MEKINDLPNWLGRCASRRFNISEEMVSSFSEISGDKSPIHIDDLFAQKKGLKNRIAHGALQLALVSSILGMDLPGANGLLQELAMKFRKPCSIGDTIEIKVTVKEIYESVQTIRLQIHITNQHGVVVSTGWAQSAITSQ
jgi:3-hydroxybutyryl-CoA dehydratase